MVRRNRWWVAVAAVSLVAASCGDADDAFEPMADDEGSPAPPLVLATTSIWADVTANVACDGLAAVESIIPPGADAHSFEPSLAARARMQEAALVVSNGLELEEGLQDTLDAAEADGATVFTVADHVTVPVAADLASDDDDDGHGHDDHGHDDDDHGHDDDDHGHDHADDDHGHADDDHGHADDDHGHVDDHHGHDHDHDVDPHLWMDPHRVREVLEPLGRALIDEAGLDAGSVEACIEGYRRSLEEVDQEVTDLVAGLPVEQRLLVTDHDSFGYFADRYGFEVIGTVIPSTSSMAETSPAALERLAGLVESTGVRAIFTDEATASREAQAVADRVGGVAVVPLLGESLGEPGSSADTYVGMIRYNATRIVDGLRGDAR
jgi:zinc/manganese transport system substrate-binding protein